MNFFLWKKISQPNNVTQKEKKRERKLGETQNHKNRLPLGDVTTPWATLSINLIVLGSEGIVGGGNWGGHCGIILLWLSLFLQTISKLKVLSNYDVLCFTSLDWKVWVSSFSSWDLTTMKSVAYRIDVKNKLQLQF